MCDRGTQRLEYETDESYKSDYLARWLNMSVKYLLLVSIDS